MPDASFDRWLLELLEERAAEGRPLLPMLDQEATEGERREVAHWLLRRAARDFDGTVHARATQLQAALARFLMLGLAPRPDPPTSSLRRCLWLAYRCRVRVPNGLRALTDIVDPSLQLTPLQTANEGGDNPPTAAA